MDKRQFASDYVQYAVLLVAFIMLGYLLSPFVVSILAGPLRFMLQYDWFYILAPSESGMLSGMAYAISFSMAFSVLAYAAWLIYFLTKKHLSNALPWIFAAGVELSLIFASLIDRHIEDYGYFIARLAEGWLQLLVPLLPLVWYICIAAKDKRPTKKRPSGV